MQKYTVIAAKSDKDFGEKARDVFLAALDRHDNPAVILPTGRTPLPLYDALRENPDRLKPFSYRQLDEYLRLPPDHPRLFLGEMRRNVLSPLGIHASMHFNSASYDLTAEVRRVQSYLQENAPAAIAVLGIGPNGHVGFNEPNNTKFDQGVHVVDLAPETIAANSADWKKEYGSFPKRAITLGIADLKKSTETILLVRGESKAEILARALTGPVTEKLPASYLQTQPNVTVIGDEAALSILMPAMN